MAFNPNRILALGVLAGLVVAAMAARRALRALVTGGKPQGWIARAMLSLVLAIAAVVGLIGGVIPHPREHALGATAAALLSYIAVHAGIGLLFLTSNLLRIRAGMVSALRHTDLRLTRLWLAFTAVTGAIALALVLALPSLVSIMGAQA